MVTLIWFGFLNFLLMQILLIDGEFLVDVLLLSEDS